MQLYRNLLGVARVKACDATYIPAWYSYNMRLLLLTTQWNGVLCGIYTITHMLDTISPATKRQALQAAGTFNARLDRVRHPLFQKSEFFDPQDLVQLKYESLRAVQREAYSMAQAAREFGLSRPTLYQAQAHFQSQGLAGLLPGKRGPRQAHKLTAEVLQFLERRATTQPALSAGQLARQVRDRFKIKVHPRTIEKALKPKAKRGRQKRT
jgi:transposase